MVKRSNEGEKIDCSDMYNIPPEEDTRQLGQRLQMLVHPVGQYVYYSSHWVPSRGRRELAALGVCVYIKTWVSTPQPCASKISAVPSQYIA